MYPNHNFFKKKSVLLYETVKSKGEKINFDKKFHLTDGHL